MNSTTSNSGSRPPVSLFRRGLSTAAQPQSLRASLLNSDCGRLRSLALQNVPSRTLLPVCALTSQASGGGWVPSADIPLWNALSGAFHCGLPAKDGRWLCQWPDSRERGAGTRECTQVLYGLTVSHCAWLGPSPMLPVWLHPCTSWWCLSCFLLLFKMVCHPFAILLVHNYLFPFFFSQLELGGPNNLVCLCWFVPIGSEKRTV